MLRIWVIFGDYLCTVLFKDELTADCVSVMTVIRNCNCLFSLFSFDLFSYLLQIPDKVQLVEPIFNSIPVFFTVMEESRKEQESDEENEVFFRPFTLEEKEILQRYFYVQFPVEVKSFHLKG